METQERFRPKLIGLNGSYIITGIAVGGFLAKTSGTIRLVKNNTAADVLIDDFPVTAGQYYMLPFFTGEHGAIFTAAGGASGTLGVG